VVRDANGVTLAWIFCRDDAQRYSFGAAKLTSDGARRIGKAIVRIPEFLMPRQDFHPVTVARAGIPIVPLMSPFRTNIFASHWGEIDALCCLNSLPFDSTGEVIQKDGVWLVPEFT
jgi:hypothetical protein